VTTTRVELVRLMSHGGTRSFRTRSIVPGGGFWAGVFYDIMSDSGPKTPLRLPISPPVRKKAPFSGFRGPKYALFTPLFPPKPTENRPFCAHFRALGFRHNVSDCPRPVAGSADRRCRSAAFS
jgi:hypothetical protein